MNGFEAIPKTPYDTIADIIEQWCQENYYSSFVVTLRLNGELCAEYLIYKTGDPDWPDPHWVWESDWREGQKDIALLGFIDITSLYVSGTPDNYKFITAEESDSIDTLDYYKNKLYIRDADESKSHLCNSLNAESGGCFRMAAACGKDGLYPVSKKQLETLGYYLERAQAVITYLREEVNRLEEEKTK